MYFKRDFRPQKGNCFILMPFGVKEGPGGQDIDWDERYREVLEPAIKAIDMVPGRADDIYGTQSLIDRVWRGIQEAEVVVAELTGRSPNVMYEIGLANLIGKRLVLLTMSKDDVPADLANSVQIMYSDQGIGLLQLTRELQANLEAARAEPLREAMLAPLTGAEVETIPARVEYVSPMYATVKSAGGRMGFLYPEDVSYTRVIRDMQKQVRVGQQLDGAFVFDASGESRYSLVAHEDNPWPKLISEYPEGTVFTGDVKSAPEAIGIFVSLRYGINGLIHKSDLRLGPGGPIRVGDTVEAQVKRINQARRQVDLVLKRVVQRHAADAAPTRQSEGDWRQYAVGASFTGTVHRVVHDRGYILVALPPGRIGLLNVNRMSEATRNNFDANTLEAGGNLEVEIVEVHTDRNRILLRDTDPNPE
jgi:small subunit ribosomal protein S1